MKTQKRIAASLMKVGERKVRINVEDEEAAMAMTRGDVRAAIGRGSIYALQKKGISKFRTRKRKNAKKKGRRGGMGKRKGSGSARTPKKKEWMKRIRAIRKKLREMKGKEKITRNEYRKLYRSAKAGVFRDKKHVETGGKK